MVIAPRGAWVTSSDGGAWVAASDGAGDAGVASGDPVGVASDDALGVASGLALGDAGGGSDVVAAGVFPGSSVGLSAALADGLADGPSVVWSDGEGAGDSEAGIDGGGVIPDEPAAENVWAGVGVGTTGDGVMIGTTTTALPVPSTTCDLLGLMTASWTPCAVETPASWPVLMRAVSQVGPASIGQTSEMFEVVISSSSPLPMTNFASRGATGNGVTAAVAPVGTATVPSGTVGGRR